MKKITLIALMMLMLIPLIAYAADPVHGDEHSCQIDSEIIIIYDGFREKWEWYVPTGDDSHLPDLPWLRLEITRCPECGCLAENNRCWIWDY